MTSARPDPRPSLGDGTGEAFRSRIPPLIPARAVEETGCAHAMFTTRVGGVSRGKFAALNLSYGVGDDTPAVAENRRRIASTWGASLERLVEAAQVHGNRVAVVGAAEAGTVIAATDALVTDAAGIWLAVYAADCVPLLIVDPDRPAVGALHAGWRGTASGIALTLLETMARSFCTKPDRVCVTLGPAIGGCCYEVDTPVARAMAHAPWWPAAARRTGAERWRLDLREALRQQLVAAGVQDASIETNPACTKCRSDLFFSHRRDGTTGRLAGCIRLPE
ncbi:MAG TPA: peptidoglycan editing factor PgeF [bacterium]|nr:peptidoglycan editing factor PgeF [bacterium]